MSRHGVEARIHDMLSAIEDIESMQINTSGGGAALSRIVSLALERAIEIISEASRNLPNDLKTAAPHIPWRQIAGIGNVLRHDYQQTDTAVLLNVVAKDLPPLKAALLDLRQRLAGT